MLQFHNHSSYAYSMSFPAKIHFRSYQSTVTFASGITKIYVYYLKLLYGAYFTKYEENNLSHHM